MHVACSKLSIHLSTHPSIYPSIHPSIHPFNKYFLSSFYVPDTVFGTGDTQMNKTKSLLSGAYLVRWGIDSKTSIRISEISMRKIKQDELRVNKAHSFWVIRDGLPG